MKTRYMFNAFFLVPMVAVTLLIQPMQSTAAETVQTVAVLPFTINADKDITYVKKGISRMFFSRLSWPDKVQVIPPKKIQGLENDLADLPEDKQVKITADKTGSQYVVLGSITQFAGSFSIDARVYDIANKRYMSFFEQSKVSDDLIERVDEIAATINQKVFDISTVTWEKMEQEKKAYLNELKRKNPEHLMKMPAGWQPEEEVGWKVWKYLF